MAPHFPLSSFFDVCLPCISPFILCDGTGKLTRDISMFEGILGMRLCKQHVHMLTHYTTIAMFILRHDPTVPNAPSKPSNLALFVNLCNYETCFPSSES